MDESVITALSDPVDLSLLPEVFQGLAEELAGTAHIESLPLEALPLHAASWTARLLWLVGRHAYLLALLGALVENTVFLGFLLPGGTVVALAGAAARAAGLPLPVVVVLAAAGMTGGGVIDYLLGRAGADRLLRHPRAGRFGQYIAGQLDTVAPVVRRHGWWMLLLSHAFGHGRSSMAVAAGATRLSLRRYLMMEAPAAFLWALVFAGGGYWLGGELTMIELALRRAGWLGAGLLIAASVAWWLWRRQTTARPAPILLLKVPVYAGAPAVRPLASPPAPVIPPADGDPAIGRPRDHEP